MSFDLFELRVEILELFAEAAEAAWVGRERDLSRRLPSLPAFSRGAGPKAIAAAMTPRAVRIATRKAKNPKLKTKTEKKGRTREARCPHCRAIALRHKCPSTPPPLRAAG